MWLPIPVYERIPHLLFVVGLLLMSTGIYLGIDYHLTFFYFGVGFGSSVWGLCIFVMRKRARTILNRQQESADNFVPGTESTT